MLPNIQLEYFQGTNNTPNADSYSGFQVGLGIPILFGNQKAQINASKIEKERILQETKNYRKVMEGRLQQLSAELGKQDEALVNYEQRGRNLVKEIIHAASRSLEGGEIDFFQYILSIDSAVKIEMNYLQSLRKYNDIVLNINYIIN